MLERIAPSLLLMALVALPSCGPTSQPAPARGDATLGPSPQAGTEFTPAYEDCAWQWARQSLPDVTAALQAELNSAGLAFDAGDTTAYAFGENCLDAAGKVQYFAAMETDFVIAMPSGSTAEPGALGTYAGSALQLILRDFGPGAVPGPQLGNVDFVFMMPAGETRRRVTLADAQAALRSGLQGAELYNALFP